MFAPWARSGTIEWQAESQAVRAEVDRSRLLAPYRIRQYAEQIGPIQDTQLHLRATGEDGAASYRFTASAPALQTTSSCEPVPPEQPMAPTSLPPSRMGMPPRDAMTSSRVRR